MSKRPSHRPEFTPSTIYEYPEHLRQWLKEIPALPGVYVFHGESETLPLYIGKSVNLRSRVLSHLRTPDEASMLYQSKRISWTRTAGEVGALLLEAKMIKEHQPLFNKRLRRSRQLCSLLLTDNKPEVVYAREIDFAHQPGLYGLFANRRAALETLKSIADEHQLCYGLLGLESLTRGRGCFRSALHRCAGACCGKESVESHQHRLITALERLQLVCWPWEGAIALKEESADLTQYHIIRNWMWLGSVTSLEDAGSLSRQQAGFDHDGYKILCKPLLSNSTEIIAL
ncbi:excinuclease Cho [Kluyvera intermedia]|uniref:excinuclease Cho n=1 Tax=Kluyvera intermedia TaxID=61648 RepID=UPI00242E8458|nr:excinuclease Cho [Kluyvera intermedia]WEJ85834.1 MAG: excinuclease Cho [Kluyvera intermedia]